MASLSPFAGIGLDASFRCASSGLDGILVPRLDRRLQCRCLVLAKSLMSVSMHTAPTSRESCSKAVASMSPSSTLTLDSGHRRPAAHSASEAPSERHTRNTPPFAQDTTGSLPSPPMTTHAIDRDLCGESTRLLRQFPDFLGFERFLQAGSELGDDAGRRVRCQPA